MCITYWLLIGINDNKKKNAHPIKLNTTHIPPRINEVERNIVIDGNARIHAGTTLKIAGSAKIKPSKAFLKSALLGMQ
ncbi:hypothetical protein VA249_45850 (plasmid) [Vibrio alfacsensis]|nr:hypothetical protein VA249_45850 [Vibrio alfacsensis]